MTADKGMSVVIHIPAPARIVASVLWLFGGSVTHYAAPACCCVVNLFCISMTSRSVPSNNPAHTTLAIIGMNALITD